ncbi:calcium-binding protein [Sulfitobacter sp.]|uniref:calcium-binding protein n=1 Tax=Sulfitobacter sp. TaxID=1903071 RepID=UPI003001B15F
MSTADNANLIDGAAGNDSIEGRGGDDTIIGGAGNDTVLGGEGADSISGYGNDDILSGDAGNDVVRGNAGNDVVGAESGNDSVYGGSGNDLLSGSTGDDLLNGGIGFDTADYSEVTDNLVASINFGGAQSVSAQAGKDTFVSIEALIGGSGNDLLVGNSAGNLIVGGEGNDEIYGIGAGDILRGGIGNDQIEGSGGNDTMEGGVGDADVLSYFNSAGGVTVNLRFQGVAKAVGGSSGTDLFTGFEDLFGSNVGGDTLVCSVEDNRILGFAGDDLIFGFDGDDDLIGMTGADTLNGGLGADILSGGGAADTFDFNNITDSSGTSRDTIADFGVGGADLIDLSTIDANPIVGGNQAVSFIGAAGFSEAGQVRFATNGTNGFVLGDVDGDGNVDLNILLLGVTSIGASDFVL